MRKFSYIVLFTVILFTACSEYPEMNEDILAYHVFSADQMDLERDDDEYIDLLSKSFGMTPKSVRKIQKFILSKKTESSLLYGFESAMHAKVVELLGSSDNARNDFVVNVLAPYLNVLSKNKPYKSGIDRELFERDVCTLFGKFFNEPQENNSLRAFMDDIYRYNNGGVSSTDYINQLNEVLLKKKLFVDLNAQSYLNVLGVDDIVLPPTPYKDKFVSVIALKRIMPGLLPSKLGYYLAGADRVVVLVDLINFISEAKITEIEQNRYFSKYEDKRFVKFWRSIGLDMNVERASLIYNKLMKKDFLGKPKKYVTQALSMEVAIHEAKHLVDQIEHPELTLNLDAEFSAHVTAAIFNPAPNAALFSAIDRMDAFAMHHRLSVMNDVTRKLWKMAQRSAFEETYSNDSLRQDLLRLYCDYRTVREHASFGSLVDFNRQIASKVAEHYGLADSVSLKILDCQDLPPLPLPESRPQVNFPASQVKFGIPEVKMEEENAQ